MRRLLLACAAGASVCAWCAATSPSAVPPAATVRCTGALQVQASFDPARRLRLADFTRPANGTTPQPTGRILLSMAHDERTINSGCRPDAVVKRPHEGLGYRLGPYPRSNAGRIYCLTSASIGFRMQFSQIRNKKRAVVGSRVLVVEGVANVVFEARLTRTSGNVWFDSATCERRTSNCPPYAPPGAGCAAKVGTAAAKGSMRRRTATAATT